MDDLWSFFDGAYTPGGNFTAWSIVLSMLLAFVLGQVLAWLYYFTHSGMSYSKSFVQGLILICVVISMIMSIIGSNIITAFGLMGALAIIRFRNVLRDTRDIIFVFCSLTIGMASGSQSYAVAIFGTAFLSFIILYLHFSGFGSHESHNGFLRFNFAGPFGPKHPVPLTLKKFCSKFILVSSQDSGYGSTIIEYSYQLMVKSSRKNEKLLVELQKIEGLENVSLTMQETLLEV